MNTDLLAPVVAYCTQEVTRQGHDPTTLGGLWRITWMLHAWCEALEAIKRGDPLTIPMVEMWGQMIEPDFNAEGFRRCEVTVGGQRCPPAASVGRLLTTLFEQRAVLPPWEFYRGFLEIHPFRDGNGRTSKIVVNWLNGTLLQPIFPPSDFWGTPIRNP